jgi:Ricin-type beta-trefoil lectin domain-like
MKIRRGIAALLACVATSAVAPPLAATADVRPNAAIPLINVESRKCFAPTPQDGHSDWAGLPIQQRTCTFFSDPSRANDQHYYFEPIGNVLYNEGPPWWCVGCTHLGAPGYFIKNSVTGLCMDARDGAKSDGSVVQQWTCKGRMTAAWSGTSN